MSIYHLSVKVIGRSHGRSATGAAAYRAAEKILDERTGLLHDFTRKQGVEHCELIVPSGAPTIRSVFWNQVELHHKRGDAIVSREVEVALPDELTASERRVLATGFAGELVQRYGVAADVAIHAPSREGDERNHHAHIMLSACTVGIDGVLGKKAAELDPIYCQKHRLHNMADRERVRWAELVNAALAQAGHEVRVDHRSLKAQGIERIPGSHMGPSVAGMARRGVSSAVSMRVAAEVSERLARAQQVGEAERQMAALGNAIVDTSSDLADALRTREVVIEVKPAARAGVAAFRAMADQRHKDEDARQRAAQALAEIELAQADRERAERARNLANASEIARQRDEAGSKRPEKSRQEQASGRKGFSR